MNLLNMPRRETGRHCADFKQDVLPQEHARVRQRRKSTGIGLLSDTTGLALSGGGVRSATFNLGILQGLKRFNLLKHIDYLSTVSGGGYIGTCLTWFCSREGRSLEHDFPFGTSRKDSATVGGRMLSWLRDHGNIVTPGGRMGVWAFAGAILSAMLINLTIVLPWLALALVALLNYPARYESGQGNLLPFSGFDSLDSFSMLRLFGLVLLAGFLVMTIALSIRWSKRLSKSANSVIHGRWLAGTFLRSAVAFFALGCLPAVYEFVVEQGTMLWSGSSGLAGVISLLTAHKAEQMGAKSKRKLGALLWAGCALILVAILLLVYAWAIRIHESISLDGIFYTTVGLALLGAFLSFAASVNLASVHRYYRDALMRAYMPSESDLADGETPADNPVTGNTFGLMDIVQTDAPYHLVNVAMNTVGSKHAKRSSRGAENFICSPLFCGFGRDAIDKHDSYVPTPGYESGSFKLSTAMAVSGAAVNPNAYATRARPLSFLMALFNIRLGFWIRNPRSIRWDKLRRGSHVLRCLIYELLGRGLGENHRFVLLSDGGHFENLGLYELIRRRCRQIIVIDAGQDIDTGFSDLGRVVELARMDFGAKFMIDLSKLKIKQGAEQQDRFAYALGSIEYLPDPDLKDLPASADILYIKPLMIDNLPQDVVSYKTANGEFPQQSTADQWFDERQFEAYRELGYQIIKDICENRIIRPDPKSEPDFQSLGEFFDELKK